MITLVDDLRADLDNGGGGCFPIVHLQSLGCIQHHLTMVCLTNLGRDKSHVTMGPLLWTDPNWWYCYTTT